MARVPELAVAEPRRWAFDPWPGSGGVPRASLDSPPLSDPSLQNVLRCASEGRGGPATWALARPLSLH